MSFVLSAVSYVLMRLSIVMEASPLQMKVPVVAQNPIAFLISPVPIIQGVMRNPLTLSGSIYNGLHGTY